MFQALNHQLIVSVVLEKHAFDWYTFVVYPKASQLLYVGLLVCLHINALAQKAVYFSPNLFSHLLQ